VPAIGAFHNDLRETHIVGTDTPEKIISSRISPLMGTFRIGLAGVSDAGGGFEMARLSPHFGHVLACFSGSGDVWLDGRWQECVAGQAYLTPPDVPHAYRTRPGQRWGFAWVYCDKRRPGDTPLLDCEQPVLVHADGEYLRSVIIGLYRESIGLAQPAVLDWWVELLHAYTRRLGQAQQQDGRRSLMSLWEKVDANLAYPWTRQELADLVGMSGETLRRVCHRETGHGPMTQVTLMRMRRASTLLDSTTRKIESIARAVGYANAFAFSTAFKRQLGQSPAAYRASRAKEQRPRDAARERKGHGEPVVYLRDRNS
jgi:AraC-like DNA-binding protein